MFFVQHAQKKSVFTFQPSKITVSTTVKLSNFARTCLTFHLRKQKPIIILLGGYGSHCFAKTTSGDYQKEQPIPFWVELSANHIEPDPNLCQKSENPFLRGINVSNPIG